MTTHPTYYAYKSNTSDTYARVLSEYVQEGETWLNYTDKCFDLTPSEEQIYQMSATIFDANYTKSGECHKGFIYKHKKTNNKARIANETFDSTGFVSKTVSFETSTSYKSFDTEDFETLYTRLGKYKYTDEELDEMKFVMV